MRGGAPNSLSETSEKGVTPMDIANVLTLMISFGMFIAFIKQKATPHVADQPLRDS
jgi:hypothetical protein